MSHDKRPLDDGEPPKVDPVEAYIRQCAAEAPPLSAVQRDTIASLLRSAPAREDEA